MKRSFITVLTLLFLSGALFAQVDTINNGIRWTKGLSWQQVLAKAKSENKFVFVDFYATWCAPCKIMDQTVYSDMRVGHAVNEYFVSIKVQLDKTDTDNVDLRNWYADADSLKEAYKVEELPTYLFFSPNGNILHKDFGLKQPDEFVRLTQLARAPEKEVMYEQIELYKRGKKDFTVMADLALFAKNLLGDTGLANAIAVDYKRTYLDQLDRELVCTKKHLDFIQNFLYLVSSKDQFFLSAYYTPERIARVFDAEWATFLIKQVIIREEIENKLLINGKALDKFPKWYQIEDAIANKYLKIDARKLVLEYQLLYYTKHYVDWQQWAKYKEQMLQLYPPRPPYGFDVFVQLNGWGGAWLAFMRCNDLDVLKRAVEWVDLAIKIDSATALVEYLDTKANLLYKMGKIDEAIKIEQQSVNILIKKRGTPEAILEMKEVINHMKMRQPTYLHQGAIWDSQSLARISK